MLASWTIIVPPVILVVPTPVPRSKLASVVELLPTVLTVIVPAGLIIGDGIPGRAHPHVAGCIDRAAFDQDVAASATN